MKLLAIDTSTEIASVALFAGKKLICDNQSNQKTHAQFILPMIDRLMTKADLQINQLDALIFGCGPGSFTGLRIACSVAKGLAYAHNLGLIPVSSLTTITWMVRQQNPENRLPVLSVLDARMHEMYWAYFAQDEWQAKEKVSPVHEICLPDQQKIILAGQGMDLYWEHFTPEIKAQINHTLTVIPSAAAMIQFAQFAGLKPISVEQAQPVYVRNKVT